MEFKSFLGLHCPQAPLVLLCDNLLGPKKETSLQLWREWPSPLPGLCRLLWYECHLCWGHSWWPGPCALSLCSQHPLQSSQSLKRNVVEKHLPQCSSSVLFHVLRTCRWSTNTLNFSVLLPSFQAAADFQLHVSCALGFLSKWDSWPRQAPPSVVSTWKCQVEAQRSPWCLHHCSLWCSSLYLLCFFGRLDSLDLQCFSGRVGKVIRECLTDLEH